MRRNYNNNSTMSSLCSYELCIYGETDSRNEIKLRCGARCFGNSVRGATEAVGEVGALGAGRALLGVRVNSWHGSTGCIAGASPSTQTPFSDGVKACHL